MTGPFHEIIWIKEKEMDQLESTSASGRTMPTYFCVTKAGTLRFWPKFEPERMRLLCQLEK